MPNIREFDLPSNASVLRPEEQGPEAAARQARISQEIGQARGAVISQGFHAIGRAAGEGYQKYDDHQTQQDILSGVQAHTQLAAKTAEELPQVLAKSDDPVQAMKDYYNETYLPGTQKINDSMSTDRSKMWAAEHTAQQSGAFFQHGMAEAMNIQGAKSIAKFQSAQDNLSVAAHANPQGLDLYTQQADATLDAIKGTLTVQQQTQLEEHRSNMHAQLALAAGHSLADANPKQFQKDLDGGWGANYLNEEQRQNLRQYSNYAERQQDMDQRRTSQEHVQDWVSNLYGDDGRIKQITPAMIGQLHQDGAIRPQDQRSAVNLGVSLFKQQQREDEGTLEAKTMYTDPHVAADMISRIGDPTNPLTRDQIAHEVDQGHISVSLGLEFANKIAPKNLDVLAKLNNNPIVKSEFDRAASVIRGATDPGDQAVRNKTDAFKMDTLRTLQDAVTNGQDPRPLLDPKSPTYLFSPEKLDQYKPSKAEIASQIVQPPAAKGAPPPSAMTPEQKMDALKKAFGGIFGGK